MEIERINDQNTDLESQLGKATEDKNRENIELQEEVENLKEQLEYKETQLTQKEQYVLKLTSDMNTHMNSAVENQQLKKSISNME